MNIPHFHNEVSAQIKNPPHFLALKNIKENHLNLELCGKYTSYIFPLIVVSFFNISLGNYCAANPKKLIKEN